MNEQKQKHTPGPWEVGPKGQVRAMTGRQIYDPRQWTSEGQANASLIAAAPDLLAALMAVIGNEFLDIVMDFDLKQKARAAISKAEGRE